MHAFTLVLLTLILELIIQAVPAANVPLYPFLFWDLVSTMFTTSRFRDKVFGNEQCQLAKAVSNLHELLPVRPGNTCQDSYGQTELL